MSDLKRPIQPIPELVETALREADLSAEYKARPAYQRNDYGQATTYHPRNAEWDSMVSRFAKLGGSRQIFDLEIDLIQTSCGTGVPEMDLRRSRGEEDLEPYYDGLGPEGVKEYWQRKNVETIDGRPTGIFED